jgi:Spy/CpxP family protein refolding chaperone
MRYARTKATEWATGGRGAATLVRGACLASLALASLAMATGGALAQSDSEYQRFYGSQNQQLQQRLQDTQQRQYQQQQFNTMRDQQMRQQLKPPPVPAPGPTLRR